MTRGGDSRKGKEIARDDDQGNKRPRPRPRPHGSGVNISDPVDLPLLAMEPYTQPQVAEPTLRDERASRSSQDSETPAQSSGNVRGSNRPRDPLPVNRRLDAIYRHGSFLGDEVPSYFLRAIKRCNIKFWPVYSSIDRDVIENIWKNFLGTFNLVDATEIQAKNWFEADSQKKWKDFITKTKRRAIMSTPVQTVDDLPMAPRPNWCHSDDVWRQFIQHWQSDKQQTVAKINSKNRKSTAGRPEGMLAVHSYGSKSVRQRIYEVEKSTGVEPSPLQIIRQQNKKKNKETQEDTGEFFDPKKEAIIAEYIAKYKETYGDDTDPMSRPIVKSIWTSIEAVQAGLTKGRIYGVGSSSSSSASQLLVDHPAPPPPVAPDQSTIDEITRGIESRMQEQMQAQVQAQAQAQAQLQAQMEQIRREAQEREDALRQQMQEMQQLIARMCSMQNQQQLGLPPSPVVSSVGSNPLFMHQLQQVHMPMMPTPQFPGYFQSPTSAAPPTGDNEEGQDEEEEGEDEESSK